MDNNKREQYQNELNKVDQEFDALTQKLIEDLQRSNIESVDLNYYVSLKTTLGMRKSKILNLMALSIT